MPRFSQDCIVPPNEIMTDEEIRRDLVTNMQLHFASKLDCIKWFARRRLLSNVYKCVNCKILMSLLRSTSIEDGFRWRCKHCFKYATIRSNSFFERSRLPVDKLIRVIYGWTMETPQAFILRESDLRSNTTYSEWCSLCLSVCEQYFIDNPIMVGGLNEDCTSKVVKIYELDFFNRKFWQEEHWIIGGIEPNSGELFLIDVPARSMNRLSEIFEKYILPGTLILSDEGAYKYVAGSDGDGIYEHGSLIQEDVADPNGDMHRVDMKNLWTRAKKKLSRQCTTSEAKFSSYFYEFMWRNKFKNADAFAEFMICVGKQYILQP